MGISIVITNYNYGHYFSECIESVLSQTYSDFEVIVVDDASTDNSWEIIKEYAEKDKRIQIFKNQSNLGVFHTIKKGLELASFTYFHWLSVDDKYMPGFLEMGLGLLKSNPKIGVFCSDFCFFKENDSNNLQAINLIEGCNHPEVFPPSKVIDAFNKLNFWIPGPSCIVKRDLIFQYGFFDKELYSLQDWFLFHKIAFFEGVCYAPKILTAMRIHSNAFTASCSKSKETQRKMRQHLFEILADPANNELFLRFKKAANLGPFFKNFDAIKNPKFWSFYPYLIRRSLRNRLKKLKFKSIE